MTLQEPSMYFTTTRCDIYGIQPQSRHKGKKKYLLYGIFLYKDHPLCHLY